MGPFELMDLVGIDVGYAVARSFYEQSHGEPRWRPSPLAARLAATGRLGRKSGARLVRLPAGPPAGPAGAGAGGGDGLIVVAGETSPPRGCSRPPRGRLGRRRAVGGRGRGARPDRRLRRRPRTTRRCRAARSCCCCDGAPLAAQDPGGAAAGFFLRARCSTAGWWS